MAVEPYPRRKRGDNARETGQETQANFHVSFIFARYAGQLS
jgi:hypothetical protein